jgi:membrane fusion protein (multidrug efflux system)
MSAEQHRDQQDGPAGAARRKGLAAHPLMLIGGAIGLIIVAVGALLWWLNARNYESTDDAFIDTHIVRLAPQIEGRVTAVLVNDNELVRTGQPVMTIDSADVAAKLAQAAAQKAQAQAQVGNARAQVSAGQDNWRQAMADLAAAGATAEKAAQDLARYRRLEAINPRAVAPQQLDEATSTARQSAAQRTSAAKAAQSRAAQVAGAQAQVAAGLEQVRATQASLDEAGVNFAHTRLVAPADGHVAQRTVAVGDYVQPGVQILAIVPLKLWVTANFKETQLARMRPGQTVSIRIDACPGGHIRGRVDSIQRGAGQAFGILPAQNATGNYVKVVQRVPVKIALDNPPPDCPLGPGMSVTPTVRVR